MIFLFALLVAAFGYDVIFQNDPTATIAQFPQTYAFSDTGPLMAAPTQPYLTVTPYGANRTDICAGFNTWMPAGHHGATRLTMSNLNIRASFQLPLVLSMFFIEDCKIIPQIASTNPTYDIVLIIQTVKADGSAGQWVLLFLVLRNIPVTPSDVIDCSPHINFSYLSPRHYMRLGALTETTYGSTIDIMPCLRHAVQNGTILATDKINKIRFQFRFSNGEMCIRVQNLRVLGSVLPILVQTQHDFSHHSRYFRVDVYGFNPLLSDYIYLDKPELSNDPTNDMSILYHQTVNQLNAIVRYIVGNYGSSPVQQIIPTVYVPRVSDNISLKITAPLVHSIYPFKVAVTVAGQTAKCVSIKIRNDWNSTSLGLDNNTRQEPHYQIKVCFEYSLSYSLLRAVDVSFGGQVFEQYDGSDTRNSNTWNFKLFKATTMNLFNNLDVMPFVHYVNSKGLLASNAVVAALEVGLWIEQGKGELQPGGLTLSSLMVTTPQVVNQVVPLATGETRSEIMKIVQSSAIGYSLEAIILVPNICLLSNMLSLIRFIKDLSFFQYHRQSYDRSFWNFSRVSWDVEGGVLIPAEVTNLIDRAGLSYSKKINVAQSINLPQSYERLDEGYHFLKSTEMFWIFDLPLSSAVFTLLFILRRVVKNAKTKSYLDKYRCFSFLAISLISENVLFFSFRAFSQLFFTGGSDMLSVVNMTISYTILFVGLIYSVASPWIFAYFNNRDTLVIMYDEFRVTRKTFLCQTIYLTMRFFSGSVHSLLYTHSLLQIILLTAIQIGNLTIWIIMRGQFIVKSRYAVRCSESCLRILLHLILIGEVAYGRDNEIVGQLATVNQIILASVFILSVLDALFGFTIEGNYKNAGPKLRRKLDGVKKVNIEITVPEVYIDQRLNDSIKPMNGIKKWMKIRKLWNSTRN